MNVLFRVVSRYFLLWYEFQWHFYCNYGVDRIKWLVIVSPAVIMLEVKGRVQLCGGRVGELIVVVENIFRDNNLAV